MAKSILQSQRDNTCYLCGANGTMDHLETHHIFGGPNKKLSEKYGLKVKLCGFACHRCGKQSVHMNESVRKDLQAAAQKRFEEVHGTREEFQRIFGRNYIL